MTVFMQMMKPNWGKQSEHRCRISASLDLKCPRAGRVFKGFVNCSLTPLIRLLKHCKQPIWCEVRGTTLSFILSLSLSLSPSFSLFLPSDFFNLPTPLFNTVRLGVENWLVCYGSSNESPLWCLCAEISAASFIMHQCLPRPDEEGQLLHL